MGPAQFRTQCVANWKGQKEPTHMTQIGHIEAPAKLRRQHTRQRWQQLLAIRRTRLATLLELDNMSADLPACFDLNDVHAANGLLAGLTNQLSQAAEQGIRAKCTWPSV